MMPMNFSPMQSFPPAPPQSAMHPSMPFGQPPAPGMNMPGCPPFGPEQNANMPMPPNQMSSMFPQGGMMPPNPNGNMSFLA